MPKHDEHNKKVIGERLNTLLAVKDLKQKDIADLLGVTENTVSYYVTGARCPNTDQIIAIAKKWNVSADYLLGLSDVMSTDQNKKIACEVTGLTEENVEFLVFLKAFENEIKKKYEGESEEINLKYVEYSYLKIVNLILNELGADERFLSSVRECLISVNNPKLYKDDFNSESKIIRYFNKKNINIEECISDLGGFLLAGESAADFLINKMEIGSEQLFRGMAIKESKFAYHKKIADIYEHADFDSVIERVKRRFPELKEKR